jgi:glycosyltransferase involved in cell wall biosynthesis
MMSRLHYVSSCWFREDEGQFFTYGFFQRLYENLLQKFQEVVLIGVDARHNAEIARLLSSPFSTWLPQADVRVFAMEGSRLRRNVRHTRELWKAMKDAELVCINMPSELGFLAAVICKLRRKPFFVQILGDWEGAVLSGSSPSLARKIKALLAGGMTWTVVRESPLVLVQSQALYDRYSRQNRSAVRSNIVHSTLTPDVFYDRGSEPFHAPIRVLSVSALAPRKGLETLLLALRLMLDRGLSVEWWCVGAGPSGASLMNSATELGLREGVRFLGYVPFGVGLLEIYRQCDIFVHPSLSEGLPNALLEAMANSLPVVASAVGGIPGEIKDGVQAILVEPGRPGPIADAIRRLIENPDRANAMRSAALAKAQEFRSEDLAARALRLVEQTFGGTDHRPFCPASPAAQR